MFLQLELASSLEVQQAVELERGPMAAVPVLVEVLEGLAWLAELVLEVQVLAEVVGLAWLVYFSLQTQKWQAALELLA